MNLNKWVSSEIQRQKKLEGGIFTDPRKGYQMKQFVKGTGGITRTFNPFLGPGKGLRSGPTPLGRQAPRLIKQGAKKLLKLALTRKLQVLKSQLNN